MKVIATAMDQQTTSVWENIDQIMWLHQPQMFLDTGQSRVLYLNPESLLSVLVEVEKPEAPVDRGD